MSIKMIARNIEGRVLSNQKLQIAPWVDHEKYSKEDNQMFFVETNGKGEFSLDDKYAGRQISTSRANTGASAYVTVAEGATLKIDTQEPARLKVEQERRQAEQAKQQAEREKQQERHGLFGASKQEKETDAMEQSNQHEEPRSPKSS